MKARTKARGLALQALFEIDLTGHTPGQVFQDRLDENTDLDETLVEFSRLIVVGVSKHAVLLDKYIAEHAPEWPVNQVAAIDRNIIRIALWEFIVEGKTPTKVAINEAIELAKMFGTDSTPRFINGVLGSLALRENEIRQRLLHDLS